MKRKLSSFNLHKKNIKQIIVVLLTLTCFIQSIKILYYYSYSAAMKIKFSLYYFFIILLVPPVFSQGISGSLSINNGAIITNNQNKEITLIILAKGATQMMISNNGSFIGVRWRKYENKITNWKLIGEDGKKNVYAKFRDNSGNISETIEGSIELDRQPPIEPNIIINAGKDFINNKRTRTVFLELKALEAFKLRISNRNDFIGSGWLPYRTKVGVWKISPQEGLKVVYAQFMDKAGNVTEVVSDTITLDTTPPIKCKIQIANGEKYTHNHKVMVTCSAEGAYEMIIRGSAGWIPYTSAFEMDLSSGDGEKQIIIRFRDEVGNQSVIVYDNIIVDTKPPKNALIRINNGSQYTRKNDVNIKTLVNGASQILVSNDPTFKRAFWKPYSPFVSSWTLPEDDGEKTVFVKFKDRAGNISDVFNDKVFLDKTPPTNPFIRISAEGAVYDSVQKVTLIRNDFKIVDLEIKVDEARYMMLSNISTFYGSKWEIYKPKYKDWELGGSNDGIREIFVKFRDKVGNLSKIARDKVIIDTRPPIDCKLSINDNSEYCIDKEANIKLSLFARAADSMIISNNPTFKDAIWEKYNQKKKWKLRPKDGISTVLAKYKDLAGNKSEPVMDNIILDRIPPTDLFFTINKGEKTTNHPDKVVLLKVKAKEAVMMQVSTISEFKGVRWRKYTPLNFNSKLVGDDGIKIIYVRFKDEAGNISTSVADTIKLDKTPPKKGTIKIEGGKKITNNKDKSVALTLYANGVSEMRISNRFDFEGAKWMPYKESNNWVLSGDDGLKTVYAQFKDRIGNISKTAYDRIGVDSKAPKEGRISLNQKAKYCTNVNGYVTIKLYAIGATHMMLSNNSNFENAEWIPYELIYQNWILGKDDGEKTVYAKFKDHVENETLPITASIILDRQEPVSEEIIINNGDKYTSITTNRVSLELRAEGATEMIVANNPYFRAPATWKPLKESLEFALSNKDGEKTVYTKFRDKAGNESSVAKSTIIKDTDPPIAIFFRINQGQATTEKATVSLFMKAKKADFMKISNTSKFTGAIWESYSEKKDWTLKEGGGQKVIYIKFKDNAQNTSPMKFASVTLLNNY